MQGRLVLLALSSVLFHLAPFANGKPLAVLDSATVTTALNALVPLDVNAGTDSDVVVNYQNMASHTQFGHDNAPDPFFTSVSAALLAKPTYAALVDLQAQYTIPDVDTADPNTAARNASISAFLDELSKTSVYQSAQTFLAQQSLASADADTFKQQLYALWFNVYARNSVAGSSGFEAVFAGETQSTNVTRFSNWVRFYKLESAGQVNYHGWFIRQKSIEVQLQFAWGQEQALIRSFLLNFSPEFEFSAYTICALSGLPSCTFTKDGNGVTLYTQVLNGAIDDVHPENGTGGGSAGGSTPKPSTAKPSSAELQKLVDDMRAADVDRAIPDVDYHLNWGNKISGANGGDVSPDPLYTWVNESVFERPVYSTLREIYTRQFLTPDVCTAEPEMTGFRKSYFQAVIDSWCNTSVYNLAYQYLYKLGKATDPDTFKTFVTNLWLGTYSRCKGPLGSSGFEHVFSGEYQIDKTVDGQHNWMRVYYLEKNGSVNYFGYDHYDAELTGTFKYTWGAYTKPTGGYLFGTSPAFDFSLYTVCALTESGAKKCAFNLDGFPIKVTSYTQSCDAGTCLSTSYPTDT